MNEIIRQRMIVRQNALGHAVTLLDSEMVRSEVKARIPISAIKTLAKEIEEFVWELDTDEAVKDKAFNKATGKVEEAKPKDNEIEVVM